MPSRPSPLEQLPSLVEVRREQARRSFMRFVPWLTEGYQEPQHLAPLVDAMQRAVNGEQQFICCSAPPGHAKTDTLLHAPAWALMSRPDIVFSYSTYADRLSRSKSRKARSLARQAGHELEALSVSEWRTPKGGGMLAGGVGGPLLGHRVHIGLVDDPVKNRAEAESPVYRQQLEDFVGDTLVGRLYPNGSIFVFMHRWHPDDLIGHLVAKRGFRLINLPAIDDDGKPLWPQVWPVDALEVKRSKVTEYTWQSIYQGRPRPRGATVFGPPTVFTVPHKVYRSGFGVDLSYSTKTSAHWSVAVEGRVVGDVVQIHNVLRRQVRAPQFKAELRGLYEKAPTARMRWYASTTEVGVADLFRDGDKPVPLFGLLAKGDKLTRAQGVAAAWNAGKVQVPANAPWLDDFLAVVLAFTGVHDACDDDVDALAAMFDELTQGGGAISTEPTEATRVGAWHSTEL